MTTFLESDEELVLLTSCADTSEAALVRSLMEAHGIPVLIQGEHTHGLKGVLGESDEVRVLVKRKHLSEAQALLDASIVEDEEEEDEEEEQASAPGPAKREAREARRERRSKQVAWAVILLLCSPLLVMLAKVPREMRLRPHRETHERQLLAGDKASEAGQFQAAEAAYRQALGAAELLPEEEGHLPDVQTRLALALMEQERWSDAEPLLRAALPEHARRSELEKRRGQPFGAPAFANDHAYLGEVLRNLEQYGEAELHLRKAIAAYRNRIGVSDELIAASLQLSAVMMERERPALAVSALEDALRPSPLPPAENQALYNLLASLAVAHQTTQQHEQAVKVCKRALALGERLHGKQHPELLGVLGTYAGSLRVLGRADEALVLETRRQELAARQQATGTTEAAH
jgi:tetratricopeptide (TPR) repeat protein